MPDSKPLVVFVPGLAVSSKSYGPLLNELKKSFDVRSADPPLDFPSPVNWDFFFHLIDKAAGGHTRFHVVGHSLGGAIALAYGADHPEKVAKLTAVAPVLFPFQRRKISPWKLATRSFLQAARNQNLINFANAVKDTRQRNSAGRLIQLRRWAGEIDLSDRLGKIPSATVLWMAAEEVIPNWQLERLRTEYPRIAVETWGGYHNRLGLAPGQMTARIQHLLHE